MATNNALNNQCRSDFTVLNSNLIVGDAVPAVVHDLNVQKSKSGANVGIESRNTSNTANSDALLAIVVGGASAGDPYLTYNIAKITNWSHGIRNADSDAWYLSPGNSLATSPSIRVAMDGNTTINFTGSGATGGLIVNNTNNTASSQAYLSINTAGTTAGNALIQLSNTVGSVFSISHASATNSPLIFSGGNPGTNNSLTIAVAGQVTNVLQPAFLAYLASTIANVTGNSTPFQLGTTTALTEVFDQGGNFNTNGTFTSPVGGKYQLNAKIRVNDISIAMTSGYIQIITSNRIYTGNDINCGAAMTVASFSGYISFLNCVLADMDAADTAVVSFTLFGGAGNTADLVGGSDANSAFSGFLAC